MITATKSWGFHKHLMADGRCLICNKPVLNPHKRHGQIKALEPEIVADFIKHPQRWVCSKYKLGGGTLYSLPGVRRAMIVKHFLQIKSEILKQFQQLSKSDQEEAMQLFIREVRK